MSLQDTPYIVQERNRVAVLLFGYFAVVRVKRVFVSSVYYGDAVEEATVFETSSGLCWTTHPCGRLLDFYGRGTPSGEYAEYEVSAAQQTWIRHVLQPGERSADPWALGEA